jgi:hypothetical protein
VAPYPVRATVSYAVGLFAIFAVMRPLAGHRESPFGQRCLARKPVKGKIRSSIPPDGGSEHVSGGSGGAMGDVIFACDKDNYQARQTEFRGPKHQEYYDGDYLILPGKDVDVRIEKGLECAYPILKLRTCTDTIFERNWSHIQRDKTDVTILWFVNRGYITISDCNGTNSIEAGECRSRAPCSPFTWRIT